MNEMHPIAGLILAGGQSRRMGRDKASLAYGDGEPQWRAMARLLKPFCERVVVSVRAGQTLEGWTPDAPDLLVDDAESNGPLAGVLTAFGKYPGHAVLAVACDLPLLGPDTLEHLLSKRDGTDAIVYRSAHDGLPEPLCALYEPPMQEVFSRHASAGMRCPRKVLIREETRVRLVDLVRAEALDNANTPEDYERLRDLAGMQRP